MQQERCKKAEKGFSAEEGESNQVCFCYTFLHGSFKFFLHAVPAYVALSSRG